jgi:aminopeptidase
MRKGSTQSALQRAERRLARAARVAIGDVLRLRRGERAVIITNPEEDVLAIAAALFDAATDRGADTVLLIQPRRRAIDRASDAVIHALRSEPEVIVSISADKLGQDRFGLERSYRFPGVRGTWEHIFNALRGAKRSRGFWSPAVTLDSFCRTVPVDYTWIRRQGRKLKTALDAADSVLILSPGGTDIEIGLRGRKAKVDDGAFGKPGSGGNLPAGETYIGPANSSANGVIVFDGSVAVADGAGAFVPRKPITVEVLGGLVTRVRGGADARRLENSLRIGEEAARAMRGKKGWSAAKVNAYARHARHLGELGIGLNRAARVTGNMLEDEKILGTCHIAIGSNVDEDALAFTHLDCIIQQPTIITIAPSGRMRMIMESGRIL